MKYKAGKVNNVIWTLELSQSAMLKVTKDN